ncbi:MAG: class I SAM-dependent methyltransferase [Cyclobacteriaceae bacterium]
MSAVFDIAAPTYDNDFTQTQIGSMQRNQVWKYLDRFLKNKTNLKVLELNCGTGEDALRMGKMGHNVLATDISKKMIEVAASKVRDEKVDFLVVDIDKFSGYGLDNDYDLVFSNFGGLNCIDSESLQKLSEGITSILKKNGRFVAVIMPQFCFWETMYFLLKGKTTEAFRRKKQHVMANVSGRSIKTWYYSPGKFRSIIDSSLEMEILKPIGLFLPPSYLESFFGNKPSGLKLLNWFEEKLASHSWQAPLSDHYYIQYLMK